MTKEVRRFTLRLTGELKEQLEESGKRMGISLNALVVQILWDWAEGQRGAGPARPFPEEREPANRRQKNGEPGA